MQLTVGTFNLNNLFSRFNFEADVSTASTSTVETTTSFTFSDPSGFKLRTYKGRLVKEKPAAERKLIADRIKRIDLDVLAVQEVEDIDTLRLARGRCLPNARRPLRLASRTARYGDEGAPRLPAESGS